MKCTYLIFYVLILKQIWYWKIQKKALYFTFSLPGFPLFWLLANSIKEYNYFCLQKERDIGGFICSDSDDRYRTKKKFYSQTRLSNEYGSRLFSLFFFCVLLTSKLLLLLILFLLCFETAQSYCIMQIFIVTPRSELARFKVAHNGLI